MSSKTTSLVGESRIPIFSSLGNLYAALLLYQKQRDPLVLQAAINRGRNNEVVCELGAADESICCP